MIPELQGRGYRFVTVSELGALPPPARPTPFQEVAALVLVGQAALVALATRSMAGVMSVVAFVLAAKLVATVLLALAHYRRERAGDAAGGGRVARGDDHRPGLQRGRRHRGPPCARSPSSTIGA